MPSYKNDLGFVIELALHMQEALDFNLSTTTSPNMFPFPEKKKKREKEIMER